MQEVKLYQDIINEGLRNIKFPEKPTDLYEPIQYLLSIGGKRLRPALTLLAAEMFDCQSQVALPTALAIEIFHNFSLMHDDIMDKAPLRRGRATVHEKWGTNTAILSGDFMLIQSYQFISQNDPTVLPSLLSVFNRTAAEVCMGQQFDMDFEKSININISDYIEMIRLKTAVLIGASLQLGAIVAKTDDDNAKLMYQCGENLGIAFQLQDDLLDVFGDSAKFGKQIAGDILENKKTFLLLKALELADEKDKTELIYWLNKKEYNPAEKISSIVNLYNKLDIQSYIKQEMKQYTDIAFSALSQIPLPENKKEPLRRLAETLLVRNQ
jgi:geranylgeranyl diphosphate synthase type II